uniref:ABC transporter domain-containing protein n=1 Tax=Schistosoma curassoni TaxID=6186 RepID=A0A183KHE6_9TREM
LQAFVSIRRLGLFLLADELEYYSSDKNSYSLDEISIFCNFEYRFHSSNLESTDAITFENASFSWTKTGPLTLRNLNVRISRGWLVAVVGNVGSGKSSFLSACLSDMFKRSGKVSVKGSIAYVSQTAWIQQQSLQENIRFVTSSDPTQSNPVAEQIEELWYKNVVSACALETDIAHLPAGDKTEIGEKGVNLSGGQKQRVSLARAVYQRSDIYLLDDPLSAVDTHVGKHLFDNVIGPDGLLKDKTRIMTTNSFHWLSSADWIIVLNTNGEITQSGTYNEVVNNNSGHFANYLESIKKDKINDETMNESNHRKSSFTTRFGRSCSVVVPHSSSHPIGILSRSPPLNATKKLSLESSVSFLKPINFTDVTTYNTTSKHDNNEQIMPTGEALNDLIDFRSEQEVTHRRSPTSISITNLNASTSDDDKFENDDLEHGKFMTDEEIMHGHVSWSAYWEYFRARSVSVTFISVLSYVGFLGVQVSFKFCCPEQSLCYKPLVILYFTS